MRKVTVVLFILLSLPICNGQWIERDNPPHSVIFSSIDFLNSNTGCIGAGNIFFTSNAGENWSNVSQGSVNDVIEKIQVFSENTIYVKSNNAFWKTTNRGQNWNSNSSFDQYMTTFNFTSYNTGYIIGTTGRIFKTTNAGDNWFSLNLNVGSNLNQIQFVNENTGFIVGSSPSCILKTTNAGQNWTVNSFDGDGVFGISFINNTIGFALRNYNIIMKTTDGGASWDQLSSLSYPVRFIKFTSERTGYLAVTNVVTIGMISYYYPRIIKSTDYGNSWSYYEPGMYGFVRGISFIDDFIGFVLSDAIFLKTTNGGSTFISNNSNQIPDNFTLYQNYPNPFNPSTKINYELKTSADISLNIFDVNGKLLKILESGNKQAGSYSINFSAEGLASGVYYYSLITDGIVVDTKKAVLLK
ncbi:MAG: T9SS type A sorting domain-containing protein [Bacteroidetes bacterium]|nr:T9SS type A sorting domain-containing protein [Bacteroidota bacterium]